MKTDHTTWDGRIDGLQARQGRGLAWKGQRGPHRPTVRIARQQRHPAEQASDTFCLVSAGATLTAEQRTGPHRPAPNSTGSRENLEDDDLEADDVRTIHDDLCEHARLASCRGPTRSLCGPCGVRNTGPGLRRPYLRTRGRDRRGHRGRRARHVPEFFDRPRRLHPGRRRSGHLRGRLVVRADLRALDAPSASSL